MLGTCRKAAADIVHWRVNQEGVIMATRVTTHMPGGRCWGQRRCTGKDGERREEEESRRSSKRGGTGECIAATLSKGANLKIKKD